MPAFIKRLSALALILIGACAASPSDGAGLLTLSNGTYRVAVPSGWDGKSRLPLVLYLHGYGQDSAEVMADPALVEAVTGGGALLVVPDGLNRTWSHVGSRSQARDDLGFLHEVVADASRRWPIDERRIVAAGFSQGGSMVWDLACHAAAGFAAFLPMSGDFWLPYPTRCESGPVNLRHIHGMSDTTVPMAGQTIGGRFTQGDLNKGFSILRQTGSCGTEVDHSEQTGDLKCWIWPSCAGGKRLEYCLHSDGHMMKAEWLRDGIAWAWRLQAAMAGDVPPR